MAAPAIGQQEGERLRMAAGMAHAFVIPQLRNGRVVLRGSNVRNRDDRKKSGGIVGWRWNDATKEADIPVRTA